MAINTRSRILLMLVAVFFALTTGWPTFVSAYTTNPKHIQFQAAQENARANLQRAAQTGTVQAPQFQPAPVAGATGAPCYYPCVPYGNVPSYGWNAPAIAGSQATAVQQPAPQAQTSWYSTWAPCWTPPQYGWGAPATASAAPGVAAARPAQPVNTVGTPAQTCYQVWWPQCWGGPFAVCWGN